MIYNGFEPIVRTAVAGVLAYVALVLLLRVSGKRTLSKMNAFNLIVTVALPSTLAAVLLSRSTALLQGIVCFMVLALIQFVVTWYSVRWQAVRRLVRSETSLLYHGGEFLQRAMNAERVTEQDVWQAARSQAIGSMDDVAAVVLETDGNFSVLKQTGLGSSSVLRDVHLPGADGLARGSGS